MLFYEKVENNKNNNQGNHQLNEYVKYGNNIINKVEKMEI